MKHSIYYRLIVSCICVFAFCHPVIAGESDSALQLLDDAEMAFESGNIGIALKLAENAKEKRVTESTGYVETLDIALTPLAVQNAGDAIPDVREILVNRLESRAVKIIDEALLLHDAEFFNNSITEVKAYYINRSVYPEAEYLLGQIYQAEGELEIARDFYFQAIDHSYALDIPEVLNDIYYTTAYLARLMGDDNLYEVMLLNILAQNTWYTQGNGIAPYLSAAMENATRQESATKFFMLYRANHPQSINAAIQLADFYLGKGQLSEAWTCATLSSLMSFTRLYEVLRSRDQRFEYTTLESLFTVSLKYADIATWMMDQDIWRGMYTFATLSTLQGNESFANEIYTMLAHISRDNEVQKLASRALEA